MPSEIMNRFSKHLSFSTHHIAQQAAAAAQAAGASIVAGLRTCDERNTRLKDQFELRIDSENAEDSNNQSRRSVSMPIPSTAMALTDHPKSSVVNVWGNHSFDFSLRLDESGSSSGCLVATAKRPFSGIQLVTAQDYDHTHSSSIPIRCRWRRKIGQHCFDIPGMYGTVFPISADDVASKIIVEATSLDPSYKGQVAYAELGPFDLDSSTRKNLDNYLAVGSTRFMSPMDDSRMNGISDFEDGITLDVSCDDIKVIQQGSMKVGYIRDWSSRYSANYPTVTLNYHNLTQFELKLGPEPVDLLRLNSLSRNQRDLLALTIRCFHGRQYVLNSALLQAVGLQTSRQNSISKYDVETPSLGQTETESPSPTIDLLVVVQSLNSQLHNSLDKQEKSTKERDRAKIEKDALEQDISATIMAYQQLVSQVSMGEDLSTSGNPHTIALDIQQRAAHIAELETKLAEAKLQSEKYIEELELIRRDYRALETRLASQPNMSHSLSAKDSLFMTHSKFGFPVLSPHSSIPDDTFETVEIRNHLDKLQQAHLKLLEETVKKDQELETLRVVGKSCSGLPAVDEALPLELEELTHEKAALTRQLRILESENKELSENFVFIKTRYDALVASQAHVEDRLAHSTEISQQTINEVTQSKQQLEQKVRMLQKELDKCKAENDEHLTERNRLQKRNTALSRELEKNQAQLESKTKMLMSANQQLTDEKSSAEVQLKKLESTLKLSDHTLLSPSADQLKQLLIQKDAEIEKLKKENTHLKELARKLAVAD